MQAIILVGGLGTRLREVVKDRPKPMAEIENKPFAEYLLEQLYQAGIKDIIFAVGYKGQVVEEYFGTGERWNLKIHYAYEDELLGTAGAIKNASRFIKGDSVLVMNGDTYYELDYNELINYYRSEKLDMAIVLRKVQDISRYGKVTLKDNRIVGFNEKEITYESGLINGGIYIMKTSLIIKIPDGKVSLENDIIPQWLAEGKLVGGIISDTYFIDIGMPDDYYKFINDIKLKNNKYRQEMLKQTDLIIKKELTAVSSCFVEWRESIKQHLREIYGASSQQYLDFLDIKFEPETVNVNAEYRKEIEDFCRTQIIHIKDSFENAVN